MATQKQRLHLARWAVEETYYGKFNNKRIICTTDSLLDAAEVIDQYILNHKERCITYKAIKWDNKTEEPYDDEIVQMWFDKKDLKPYTKGIDCMNLKEYMLVNE